MPTMPTKTIAVVDPISTGSTLAQQLQAAGSRVVRVWSPSVPEWLRSHTSGDVAFVATVDCASIDKAVAELTELAVHDVIVGCETGVNMADELAHKLNLRGNSMELSVARRNKYLQTEAMRGRGVNAAYQALCSSADEVDAFLRAHAGFSKLVVKPNDGAGSEGVAICSSEEEVRAAYASLSGETNALGLCNSSVLLMEFLEGDEYVVDTVSRDGVHKVVAIWKYDKRNFFGAPVVYYGMHLLPLHAEPVLDHMAEYVVGSVLPALGISNGAVHTELIVTPRGPVLVEANCRLHGHDGGWVPIAEACLGYSQVSALISAYSSDPSEFDKLPDRPTKASRGVHVFVRSPVAGALKGVREDRLASLRKLASYRSDKLVLPAVGEHVIVTKDLMSLCGVVLLANEDVVQFDADYAVAQQMIDDGLFEVVSNSVGAAA